MFTSCDIDDGWLNPKTKTQAVADVAMAKEKKDTVPYVVKQYKTKVRDMEYDQKFQVKYNQHQTVIADLRSDIDSIKYFYNNKLDSMSLHYKTLDMERQLKKKYAKMNPNTKTPVLLQSTLRNTANAKAN